MPRIAYIDKRFQKDARYIIDTANEILTEYTDEGYDLTLRGLYYRFIARDLFQESWIDEAYNRKHGLPPDTKNTDKNYKRLGTIISNARLAGIVDWNHITDRTRTLQSLGHWKSPADIIETCASSYHVNMWDNQDHYCEVWVEKDAMLGIIEPVCDRWDLPYFSCRGYNSQSAMWRAAMRLWDKQDEGKKVVILHMTDHDPSGIDMARDVQERLQVFGLKTDYRRLALTMKQIDEVEAPPNPAKISDPRAKLYIMFYGTSSWELDALEPQYVEKLITKAVNSIRDREAWNEKIDEEAKARKILKKLSTRWTTVLGYLNRLKDGKPKRKAKRRPK